MFLVLLSDEGVVACITITPLGLMGWNLKAAAANSSSIYINVSLSRETFRRR